MSMRIIIKKGGGVYQWYMTFGSIGVVKQCFSAYTLQSMGEGARLKGGGVPWYHPLGETLIYTVRP